ncbi:MAG: hypothetical protein ACRETQ_12075 [Gammaproteobacteria bacterium]
MKASPIRELARRYAGGELSLEEYRKQRRHMIDAVCAGTLKIEYGERAPRKVQSRKLGWLVALPIVVVIGIAIGAALHFGARSHAETAGVRVAHSLAGAQLLHSFADSNDWSSTSVSAFLNAWQKLPSGERQAARASYLFPRLLAQLQEQIVSQQAMLELAPDSGAAARHLVQLQHLAGVLKDSADR